MLRARIIHRYLLSEMLGPFFISLGVFTFMLLIAKIVELTDLVVTRGVGLDVVGRLLLYTLPYFFSSLRSPWPRCWECCWVFYASAATWR